MIQKIKMFVVMAMASVSLLVPTVALVPAMSGLASADLKTDLCSGVDASTGASNCATATTADSGQSLKNIAQKVTQWFSIVVGAASVIMIILGGFRYITSGGDSGKVGNAKNTLIYAIIGLVIVALAQLIIRFVITEAGSSTSSLG